VIKCPGERHPFISWVLENFPKDHAELKYCEPFCAGACVFLNKDVSAEETISDIDHGLICILKSLRDEPKEFIGRIKRTKFGENAFQKAAKASLSPIDDYVEKGINEYILRRMSRSGSKKAFFQGCETVWIKMLDNLSGVAKRIKNTNVICSPFKDMLKVWDEEDTFIYLNPPALPGKNEEEHPDMTVDDHVAMLNLLKGARGKILVSGHSSPLYNCQLTNWKSTKMTFAGSKKPEVLWRNY